MSSRVTMRSLHIYPRKERVFPFQDTQPVPVFKERKPIAKRHVLRQIYMYVYMIHIAANAVAGSIHTKSMMYLIETMTHTLRIIVATVTTTYSLVKRDSIDRIAKDLQSFEGPVPEELLAKSRRKLKYLRLSALLYCVLLIVTTALFFVLVPAQKYFDKNFYRIDLESAGISMIWAILIGLVEWNSYNCIATATPLLIASYVVLCDNLRIQMLDFRAFQRAALESGPMTVEKLGKIQVKCANLLDMERRLEALFAPAVSLWIGDLLVNIVLPIRTLVNGIASFTVANVMSFFIEVVYSVCFFLILSFSLADIEDEYREIEEELFRLRNAVPVDDWQLCQQVILLQSGITSSTFTLTGWGLFEVDRSFILTIVGAVATYTVILVQLTPGEENY
ncbi:uncharacterized protein LOC135399041 [Ornithodoros turicata]|uniref:uncharacterized protein LOC135399041 n=1 Tax=Ornithodoros turicata TaxID=34597 RepID=UPI0031395861